MLNIFSLGLDDIAAQLRAQGIPVTVANFASWSSLADEAAAGYKSGRIKTIVLVGHSSGATALPDMVAKLDQLGAPVKLAIGLDLVFRTKLSGRVGRYVNFYIANGNGEPVAKTAQFQGKLENINVQNVPGVGHMSIEKNQIMQRKVISEIDAVVFGRSAPRGRSGRGSLERQRGETRHGKHRSGTRVARLTVRRRSDECRKFCRFLDDKSPAGPGHGLPAFKDRRALRPSRERNVHEKSEAQLRPW